MQICFYFSQIQLSNGVSVQDIVGGNGLAAKKNSHIKVRYSCTVESSNKVIISGEESEFTLGGDGVIQGWNIGLVGAKKGSQRMVYCPAKTAFGMVGCPPMIPPNSALVYTFDVLLVKKAIAQNNH